MMDHPIDWLSAYIDDELEADQRQLIEDHLQHCESCAAVVHDMMELKAQVAGFYVSIEPPLYLEQQVMQAINNKSSTDSWIRSWFAVPIAGVLCLAALWFLFGSILLSLVSVLFKFVLAAFYLLSNMATSIPSVFGTVVIIAVMLLMISGISLRRLLRSTMQ
jgi:anti-sigma factor RsiW